MGRERGEGGKREGLILDRGQSGGVYREKMRKIETEGEREREIKA